MLKFIQWGKWPTLTVLGCILLSGCITKYPDSESSLPFTYPLAHCDNDALEAAAIEIVKIETPQRLSQKNVCVTAPRINNTTLDEPGGEEKSRLEDQAFANEERRLRDRLEQPFVSARSPSSTLGIALSGGGSKASAFATGVLAGLSDHDMLDKADFVSSVSGGSYAAYFYYAHRIFPELRPGSRPLATTEDLYRDCIGLVSYKSADLVSPQVRGEIEKLNYCDRLGLRSLANNPEIKQQDIRYQAYLKCSQDLLRPGTCSMHTTSGIDSGISFASIAGTVITFIPSWIPNAIFDWGWSTSPSAQSYKDGIGLAYGATIAVPSSYQAATFQSYTRHCGPDALPSEAVYDCRSNIFNPDPVPLTFDELRLGLLRSRQNHGKSMPYWIINAAAPKNRTSAAWLTRGREDITNSDMFEMTAVSHGSGRYGYVSTSPAIHNMSVLDAVAASAAFLDGSQLVYSNPLARTGAGFLLNATNTDWGIDIPNYNVSTARRNIYRFLPFPLYYFDGTLFGTSASTPETKDRERSVFIRLIDGGNAENLGVYSLLKRGVKNILISDAAQDVHGTFADICGLRQRLLNTPEGVLSRHLYIPGLDDFDKYCGSYKTATPTYNIYGWNNKYPVMLGCIRKYESSDPKSEACESLSEDEIRLFIVKPAINLADFVNHQLEKTGRKLINACLVRGLPNQDSSLINCDSAIFLRINDNIRPGRCPLFPQHSTVLVTANSSGTIFTAYRELARQYVATVTPMLSQIIENNPNGVTEFERITKEQMRFPVKRTGNVCPPYY